MVDVLLTFVAASPLISRTSIDDQELVWYGASRVFDPMTDQVDTTIYSQLTDLYRFPGVAGRPDIRRNNAAWDPCCPVL